MSSGTVQITLKPGYGARVSVKRPGFGIFESGKTRSDIPDDPDTIAQIRRMTMFDVADKAASTPRKAKKPAQEETD